VTVASLPARPLTVLWQATVADIEPASRYGHRNDGVAINTTVAVTNDSSGTIEFPLVLATTDPEDRAPAQRTEAAAGPRTDAAAEPDDGWEELAAAIRAAAAAKGYAPARIDAYVGKLRAAVRRAAKSELVRLERGERRFIRSHQRKVLPGRGGVFELRAFFPLPQLALAPGGAVSVLVTLPPTTSGFAAELVSWSQEASPQVFGVDAGLPALALRPALAWTAASDRELALTYRYAAAPER
jgi:hypothetical protein